MGARARRVERGGGFLPSRRRTRRSQTRRTAHTRSAAQPPALTKRSKRAPTARMRKQKGSSSGESSSSSSSDSCDEAESPRERLHDATTTLDAQLQPESLSLPHTSQSLAPSLSLCVGKACAKQGNTQAKVEELATSSAGGTCTTEKCMGACKHGPNARVNDGEVVRTERALAMLSTQEPSENASLGVDVLQQTIEKERS